MEKILVYMVTSTEASIEVNHKLAELDRNGDINIYESLTIRKEANGGFDVLKDGTADGGWKTVGGAALGSLIGIIGGPLGMLLGGLTGTVIGAAADTEEYAVSTDFIDRVKDDLKSGEIAIITVLEEASPDFVDTALKPIEGRSFRTDTALAYDAFEQRVDDALQEERAEAKAERQARRAARKEKRTEHRASLKKKISDWWNNL